MHESEFDSKMISFTKRGEHTQIHNNINVRSHEKNSLSIIFHFFSLRCVLFFVFFLIPLIRRINFQLELSVKIFDYVKHSILLTVNSGILFN